MASSAAVFADSSLDASCGKRDSRSACRWNLLACECSDSVLLTTLDAIVHAVSYHTNFTCVTA